MPNLIIKPQTGSGNSVILQDQAGGAVLTTADSGGSIAASVLAASTFPAGHVVKTAFYQTTGQISVNSTTFNTADVAGDFKFTPTYASSDILLIGHATSQVNSTGSYFYMDFYKNASDVTETCNLSTYTDGIAVSSFGASWGQSTLLWLDTCSENSTSEKTYKFAMRISNSAGLGYIGWSANAPENMIIQEIKR